MSPQKGPMRKLVARILITGFGLWIADALLAGIAADGIAALWIAAAVLGFVNAIVRPIVVFLTLPITFLSLGLFLFVINGAMIMLVAALIPSFEVTSLGAAIVASVIVGLTNWIMSGVVGDQRKVKVEVRKG